MEFTLQYISNKTNSGITLLLSCNCFRTTTNQSPFKHFATRMPHPLLKLMFYVHLVINEERVKHLLLLYKWLIQPSLAVTGDNFSIFCPYDTPTFRTKALHLVSNEGWVKHLLLPYIWLIQFLQLKLATHFITRTTLIEDIDGKSHKMKWN